MHSKLKENKIMNIKIYTDGACSSNPGPGGWGCVLQAVLPNGQLFEREHSGGYRMTTNNRMELIAIINGFAFINGVGHDVEVISDSKYVCNAFNNGWINNWRMNNWTKGKNGRLPNADLWRTLWNLVTMQRNVKFTWVKGHENTKLNNKCDKMAVAARKDTAHLELDFGYEQGLA